jgi:hypothetical protein
MNAKVFVQIGLSVLLATSSFGFSGSDRGSKDTPPLPPKEFACTLTVNGPPPAPAVTPAPQATVTPTPQAAVTPAAAATPVQIPTGDKGPFESFPTMKDSFEWSQSGFQGIVGNPDPNTAYIFHVTTWVAGDSANSFSLATSAWYLYSLNHWNTKMMKLRSTPLFNGDDPLMYGLNSAVLIAIQGADGNISANTITGTLAGTYNISLAQQKPANITNLIATTNALLGAAGVKGALTIEGIPLCVESIEIPAVGKQLPYDITFAFTQTVPSKDDPKKTTDGPATNRTVHALDREYWDIGMGANFLGVRQTLITDSNGTVASSVSNRVNAYVFGDFVPFAHLRPSDWYYPHIVAGLPINGQPLHSPFAGLSQPIPLVEKYFSFPLSVFGGVVFMRERIPATLTVGQTADTATFNADLHTHWVRKRMFGVELPVLQLISKIKPK